MVNRSPVLVMAAPPDPLPHKLQHQHNSSNNVSANSNADPWGTWEELLLGSAVLKHGANNWSLVSQELQSRARASFFFTPEACRAGYHAIQLRFGADEDREGGSLQWYEELRRLRVAHLKRELEQYDSSIGSLESKIKRLESERHEFAKAQGSHAEPGGCESNEASGKVVVKAATHAGDSQKNSVKLTLSSGENEADRSSSPDETTSNAPNALMHRTSTSMSDAVPQAPRILKKPVSAPKTSILDESTGSLIQHHDVDKKHAYTKSKQDEQPPTSNSTLYLSLSKSDTSSKEQEKRSRDSPLCVNGKKNGGCFGGRPFEVELPVSSNACPAHENPLRLSTTGGQGEDREEQIRTRHALPFLHTDEHVKVSETVQGNASSKAGISPSLKSVNIEVSKKVDRSPYTDDGDDASRKSDDESQSLCSPRLKSQPAKRKRNTDISGSGLARDVSARDHVDDKKHVQKVNEKHITENMSNRPVESADSTEGKGQRVLAIKTSNQDAMAVRIKKEMITCKEEEEVLPGSSSGRDVTDRSRKIVSMALNSDKKAQSTSSTENSLHREVWGESAEVVSKEIKPTRKRRRLGGRVDWNGKAIDGNDSRGLISVTPPASSVKTEFLTTSHEASESMQSPGGKEDLDRERWNEAERLSGDSRYEKSEVGSYVDGNEDNSPMSRRNRREPKVSGKLIPLLESLRAICAHRCAHFFRHSHEPENDLYYQIVRVPMDLVTIRTRLEEGHYSGSMHFFRDLLLMVSNAMVFYPKDSAESAAAFGLRECVLKEMGHVFETEALVKQEGPSFRKRDSKQTFGQSRRKEGRKSSSMDRALRERERLSKQSDSNIGFDSRHLSHQSFASGLDDGIRGTERGADGIRSVTSGLDVQKTGECLDGKKTVNKKSTEFSSCTKVDILPLNKSDDSKEKIGKVNEVQDATPTKSSSARTKDTTIKDGLEHLSDKGAGFVTVGSTVKGSVAVPHKGKESGHPKPKAAPSIGQEPVKRGVGRPPKHAQQITPKARDVDASISTRKRSRR